MIRACLKAVVRLYQVMLSPFFGQGCRFHPTCSHYALEAIDRHGPFKGVWMTSKRILRCHPLHPGGFDPVP